MNESKYAPELNVGYWLDENGKETDKSYKIKDNLGKFQLLFCYQHACPGCHLSGFPSLQNIISQIGDEDVAIYVIQTVFEDFTNNTKDKLIIDKEKYQLNVPFGFDSGEGMENNIGQVMREYQTGGTPWFVLIDKEGEIVFADFRVHEKAIVEFIKGHDIYEDKKD